jgi:hypothetical protein
LILLENRFKVTDIAMKPTWINKNAETKRISNKMINGYYIQCLATNSSISQGALMENDQIEVYNYLDMHAVINNSIIEVFSEFRSEFRDVHKLINNSQKQPNKISMIF